jgi:putative intracellular protease/amidase
MTEQVMTGQGLHGKKIAVLVESQYIPAEIECYQERFASYGATVDLMSYLWGQPSQTFVSEVEEPGGTPETLQVSVDVTQANLDHYAAVIMAANYPSVRLRWNEAAVGDENPQEAMRKAPAVRFFREAMRNPRIVKAAPCHALWLLTTCPDYLAGRRVTCNPVALADVLNAGAVYVPAPADRNWWEHVVVDRDLVTSMSAVHDGTPTGTERLVDVIRDQITAADAMPRPVTETRPVTEPTVPAAESGRRHILMVVTEWGYWGEELVGPLLEFDRAGYEVDFCTPTGRRANAIPVSMDADFFDPPLQRSVTTPEMAALVREMDDPSTEQGKRLEAPISLAGWYPRRPYFASPQFVRELEQYHRDRERADRGVERYDALLIVGGAGALVDLANNIRVHDLILAFLAADKLIGAECYGVGALAFARDMNLRQSIIRGKHVTGHCLEYDYQDGTGFVRARNETLDFDMGPPPYALEFVLRDATAPDGVFHGNFGHPTSVVVDYPFITGRSTPDSILTGQKMIEALDGQPPLRRWGW